MNAIQLKISGASQVHNVLINLTWNAFLNELNGFDDKIAKRIKFIH